MFFFCELKHIYPYMQCFLKKNKNVHVSIFSSTNKPVLIGVLESSVAASWITMAET